jgi:pimeloyl-ACP methyl ester carboxylesterase
VSSDWIGIQSEIAEFTSVCSYDRAGRGKSDQGPTSKTGLQFVEALRTLLGNAQISGLYVLVGHSFGGLLARLYGSVYPDEVVGMVLVDPAHEDFYVKYFPFAHDGVTTSQPLNRCKKRPHSQIYP